MRLVRSQFLLQFCVIVHFLAQIMRVQMAIVGAHGQGLVDPRLGGIAIQIELLQVRKIFQQTLELGRNGFDR